VLDSMGGETARRSIECMNNNGTLVSIIGTIKDDKELYSLAEQKNISIKSILVHTSSGNMKQIAELIEKGKLKINIDKTFPFDKIGEAHLCVETHSTRGKVIITI
jgi:NADPH:quinone reductase-like Zn-dependent oxidoreductase